MIQWGDQYPDFSIVRSSMLEFGVSCWRDPRFRSDHTNL